MSQIRSLSSDHFKTCVVSDFHFYLYYLGIKIDVIKEKKEKYTNINKENDKNLWDKTVPAAYAKRVGVVYLLENSLTRFYNIFSSVSWSVLQISYLVCSAFSVYIGQ